MSDHEHACSCSTCRMARWRATGTTMPTGSTVQPQPWIAQGACHGKDPDLFFPGQGESTREAKAVCAGCPVREQCLDYALEHGEKFGIWGGTSERERRRLRTQRRRDRTNAA